MTQTIETNMIDKKQFVDAIPQDKIALFDNDIDDIYEDYLQSNDGRLTLEVFIQN